MGIRLQESFNRRRAMYNQGTFITDRGKQLYAKPIFDWKWQDVWKAIRENGWDYTAFYDKMTREGRSPHLQRISSWGNVAAARESYQWAAMYPEMWERAIRRLPELKAQARYGRTRLYRKVMNKPAGLTWQEYVFVLLDELNDEKSRAFWLKEIRDTLLKWRRKHSVPFPQEPVEGNEPHGGRCWKGLAMAIAKNDLMGRDRM